MARASRVVSAASPGASSSRRGLSSLGLEGAVSGDEATRSPLLRSCGSEHRAFVTGKTTLIKTIEGPDLIHTAGFEAPFFSKIARIKPLRVCLLGGTWRCTS